VLVKHLLDSDLCIDKKLLDVYVVYVNYMVGIRMDKSLRRLRLRQLDASLQRRRFLTIMSPPKGGWVSEIRKTLGMSTAHLGRRLGLTRQGVSALEHGEAQGSLTLKSLKRAADALECDVVYALAPRRGLENFLDRQARAAASTIVGRASHSMSLERQAVSKRETAAQVRELKARLRSEWPRNIWDLGDREG
jgi:predicted DNA-binding mobile mystery protein A